MNTVRRYSIGLLIFLCGMSLLVLAQQDTPASGAKFSSRTELVLVPVLVHDASGQHVGGLTQDKFQLLDKGKPRKISVFEEVKKTAELSVPMRSEREFGNYVADPQNARRVTVILIDLLSLTSIAAAPELEDVGNFDRVRQKIIKYLSENLDSSQPTSLMVLNTRGVRQLHNFTTDPKVLIDALKQFKVDNGVRPNTNLGSLGNGLNTKEANGSAPTDPLGYFSIGAIVEALTVETSSQLLDLQELKQRMITYDQLRALELVGRAFSGVPGRKSLVWVSAGFPWPEDKAFPTLGVSKDALQDTMIRDSSERVFEILANANVAVYPIDMIGFRAPGMVKPDGLAGIGIPDPRTGPVQVPSLDLRQSLNDTFQIAAKSTGGRPCLSNNDVADCLHRATKDSDSYYMLGFYLPSSERDRGQHKLSVSVQAKYSDLRYRQNYTAGDAVNNEDPNQALREAYSSPLDFTGLPFDVVIGEMLPEGDKRLVRVAVSVPPAAIYIDSDRDNFTKLEFSANAFDQKNESVAQDSKVLQAKLKPESVDRITKGGLTHILELRLPLGRYQLRCVVRDDLTGRIGTVSAPLVVK